MNKSQVASKPTKKAKHQETKLPLVYLKWHSYNIYLPSWPNIIVIAVSFTTLQSFFFFLRIIEEVMTCLEKYICYTNAKGSHHFWLLIICNHPTVKTSFWNMFIRCTWFLVVSTFPENKANPVRICIIIIFPKGTHKISETWTLSIEKSYFTFHKHFLQ